MSQTQVITQSPAKLDLAELKTVKWISSNYYVRKSYNMSATQYRRLKIVTLFSWMLAPVEFMLISIFLFIHKLPWPDWFLQILFKVDKLIENILENISRKFEWWQDVLMVRLMWFMDSVETFIDSLLSFAIFLVKKTIDTWMWCFGVVAKFVHMLLYPYIWVFHQIMTQEKIPPSTMPEIALTNFTDPQEARDSGVSSDRDVQNQDTNDRDKKTDDDELHTNTSEYDSDVSALSESWKIGQTNIAGKYYNRIEMKATAEGRLRAAMYKRVKAQLQLMRKNSINFSRGMTFYARVVVEPKIRKVFDSLQSYALQLAKRHNLHIYYENFVKWMDSNPVLATPFRIAFALLGIPIKFLSLVSGRKRKSKRTRSMRSESLRRKTMNLVGPVSAEPIGLGKSAEPVVEDNFCNLPKSILKECSDSVTGTRDSTLTSSVDELYHTSDSGEGSHSLKEQTIEEEKEDEISEEETEKERKVIMERPKSEEIQPVMNGIEKSELHSDSTNNVDEDNNTKPLDKSKSIEKRRKRKSAKLSSIAVADVTQPLSPKLTKSYADIASETIHSKPLSPILTHSNSDPADRSPGSDSSDVSPKQKRKISFTL